MKGEHKLCAACGRRFEWRKKWQRHWDQVKYCSERCRREKGGAQACALEEAILSLLAQGTGGASICPSEATRRVFPTQWRDHLEATRAAARRLAARDLVEITQQGQVIDPTEAKGPIRIRLKKS